jgi:hypothetical protein
MLHYIVTWLTEAEVTINQILVSNFTNQISFNYYIGDNCKCAWCVYWVLKPEQDTDLKGSDRMTDGWQIGLLTTVVAEYHPDISLNLYKWTNMFSN